MNGIFRRAGAIGLIAGCVIAGPAPAADPPAFDLAGPALEATVTRGGRTLPIGQVPSLARGDRITVRADLPEDQRARYLLVSAFLSGATNPPPKDWIHEAETWKRKDKDRLLTLTVPDGARQLVLFLVPETGGAKDGISEAVRGRPGEFVRATQGLNQASLDRSRLNAFMAAIRAQENTHPEYLRTIAPVLARSLSIKLNEDCLARVVEMQAACLIENRDTLVLSDFHSNSMTQTLVGAPTDLALQLSYTREAGLGYYSPYIGVVRDIARVFGAFSNPQFGYLPALSLKAGETVSLLLNTPPSFSKPKSVLVAAMPTIGGESAAPRLRDVAARPLCGARPDLVLPVEGAPLVYSTGYAHDMKLRLTDAAGAAVEVPLAARADRGGFILARPLPGVAFAHETKAQIVGQWGFDALEGPAFTLQFPAGGAWQGDATLVSGRENVVTLNGPAPACVASVSVRPARGGARPVDWKPAGEGAIRATLPPDSVAPGDVAIEVRQHGVATPATITAKAYAQASRFDAVTWHSGDRSIEITGQRLDAVAGVEVGAARLAPGTVVRDGDTDRLRVSGEQAIVVKDGAVARIRLKDGRTIEHRVTIAAARPAGEVLTRSLTPKGDGDGLAILPQGPDILPDRSRMTFSVRAREGQAFTPTDAIEVATEDGGSSVTLKPGNDVRFESADVLIATLDPGQLAAGTTGRLRFRVVRAAVAGDWQPLARLVRMPRVDVLDCNADPAGCLLRGRDLFLIASVSDPSGMGNPVTVPAGYTSATLGVPRTGDGRLSLRLRDAPDAAFTLQANPAAR